MHFYKILSVGLGSVIVFLFVFVMVLTFRDPIVVTRAVEKQEFSPSQREKAVIGKNEVESFVKTFLSALYVWDGFNEIVLSKEINPYAEEGLVSKVLEAQAQKYGRELKGKKLSQAITFLKVKVLDDRVVCSFDRILKIENIPLVVPTEVTLSMIQKSPTRFNPMGIYVSGIAEREGGK